MLVDSMLKFLAEGGFEALELVAGQPPVLLKQGARQPLSMPPLDPDVAADIWIEG